ncbi:unnamed protein product [Prorocentrum cordatum]|uniref:Uncharacterized protein n=1 Tax=Prorocentrum cordatum TaxID=2364126 RepID=A0ABN9Q472_9DINO|nr:unnamed protein product [Polarella glacialis]
MVHVRSWQTRIARRARAAEQKVVAPTRYPISLQSLVLMSRTTDVLLEYFATPVEPLPILAEVPGDTLQPAYVSMVLSKTCEEVGASTDSSIDSPTVSSMNLSPTGAEVDAFADPPTVSSMDVGVQTQFTCKDACVQTQFTSMDAGVQTQFILKDAFVQTQFTFQDAVKTWIDRSTAQKGFTGQIALQYLIQGLELFVDLMTEPMTIPKHHVSFWFHTLFNLTDHVQSFLGELLDCLKSHRFVTGKMDRAEEARFKAPGYIVDCFRFCARRTLRECQSYRPAETRSRHPETTANVGAPRAQNYVATWANCLSVGVVVCPCRFGCDSQDWTSKAGSRISPKHSTFSRLRWEL